MKEIITAEEFKNRLITLCTRSGLSGLPRKRRDRHILLKSITLAMDRTCEYSEAQINRQLQSWLANVGHNLGMDHVELRRHLIDQEYLGRGKDGLRYWVAVSSRQQMVFDQSVESIDVPSVLKLGKQLAEEKKRRYLSMKRA